MWPQYRYLKRRITKNSQVALAENQLYWQTCCQALACRPRFWRLPLQEMCSKGCELLQTVQRITRQLHKLLSLSLRTLRELEKLEARVIHTSDFQRASPLLQSVKSAAKISEMFYKRKNHFLTRSYLKKILRIQLLMTKLEI